jgi:hypothetical protein
MCLQDAKQALCDERYRQRWSLAFAQPTARV